MILTEFWALSVRQPWAWAIVHGGKDIENRSWQAVNKGLKARGRVSIHASLGMTRDEYEYAAAFMEDRGIICPLPHELLRGGIIGTVDVVDVVKESKSPWFMGPRGLVLRNPQASTFIPCSGQLGYFRWERKGAGPAECAKWMRPAGPSIPELARAAVLEPSPQRELAL